MNINRTVFYTTFFSAWIALLLSLFFEFGLIEFNKYANASFIITIGLFTSSLVSVLISLISYFKEKSSLDAKYYVRSSVLLSNTLCVIEYVENNKQTDDFYRQKINE